MTILRISFPLVILLAFVHGPFAFAGSSALSFLKLGVSARALAMGDAGSALLSGASATYYNPAGLFGVDEGSDVLLMHKEWLTDTRMQFLGASTSLGENGSLGFSLTHLTISGIEIRTKPGPADGNFIARDFGVGISYAHRISGDVTLGLTGKYLLEKIFVDNTGGIAFDIGGRWKTPFDNFVIGGVVANIGSMNALRNERPRLPTLGRIGAAYTNKISTLQSIYSIAIDLEQDFPASQSYVKFGGEIFYQDLLAVRAGYFAGADARGFSAGLGIVYSLFSFDYAFAPLLADLGNTHTLSLSIRI